MIDFVGINHAALARGRTFLEALIPGGKFRGLEYQVRNPTRDDKRPGSFSINYRTGVWKDFATGDGGGDLISLWAYVRSIGQGEAALELADKLGIPADKPNGGSSMTAPKATAQVAAKVFPLVDDGPPRSENEARRHTYKADGKPVAIKIKFKAGGFTQWYLVAGGWQQKKPKDYLPVPYTPSGIDPFDEEYDQVLWPEGEKDVDTLGKLGLPGFTFGGVGDGLPDGIDSYLKDRRLVILADNDEPGCAHAEKKATIAHAAGAATIKIVHFPELPSKGDVSDFIVNGGTDEQLFACIDATPFWESPQGETGSTAKDWRARVVTAKDLQSMRFPPARHILPGYISEGATIIAGKPKIGKSWLTLDVSRQRQIALRSEH
jgi:putative DNA primase/helicase